MERPRSFCAAASLPGTGSRTIRAPASHGFVKLRSRVRLDPPAIDQGFVAETDVKKLVKGIELLRDLLGPETIPGPETDLDHYVRETVRGFFHPVGTAALGRVADEHDCDHADDERHAGQRASRRRVVAAAGGVGNGIAHAVALSRARRS